MKHLKIVLAVVLILLLSPSHAHASGMKRAVVQIILGATLVPLATGCVGLAWALWRSRSNWGLLCWPVLAAWVGVPFVPRLVGAAGWRPYPLLFIGAVEGISIGLLALLARAVIRRSRSGANKRVSEHS